MDTRHISEEYTEIGQELIATEEILADIRESEATIAYLGSEYEKTSQGKAVYGQCEKVPEKYKWAVPCDFTITVFEPNVERFTDEQLRILILHELMHVGIEKDGNEEKYYVRPHDIEDFELILSRYGLDWSR
jgi:hypothetical protein